MQVYWVYWVGTTTGAWVQAPTMKAAKALFATLHGVALSSYIVASRKAPAGNKY